MGLTFRKVKKTLSFKDDQPEVYKIAQLVYPVVTFEQLVYECSNSCGVNSAQSRAVIDALINRMVHYMEIGHGVKLGDFGSFKPTFNSKCVQDAESATAQTVTQKKIQFRPGKRFRDMLSELEIQSASESLNEK